MDYPIYNEPILIAEGLKVKNGKDAEIQYNFNVNKDEIHLTEEDGKVDFKNLNIIQNVVAGQILATKEPPTRGEPGRTVTNKLIMQREGKDTTLVPGKNTHLSEDGTSIISEKNGQVMLYAGKVTVEEVYTVPGDVNLKTGNITFLGTVTVQGNVEDGFSIKASGNIEIHGSVGKCVLEADGDIIISQGFMGKHEGTIRAGKSVYAKFIENAKKVEASEGVYVQDGIMNSAIDATKEITCVGKRATIVGGRLRAGELIKSKTLGSSANVFTIIEVGIDPKKRQRLDELNEERDKAYKEKEPIDANLSSLDNIRKGNKLLYNSIESTSFSAILKRLTVEEDRKALLSLYDKNEEDNIFILKEDLSSEERKNAKDIVGKVGYLPPEKEDLYQKLQEQTAKLQVIIKKTEEEIDEIEKYLSQLKSSAKIVGSKIVFPGVKIYIKSAFLEIKTEYKKIFFYLQGIEVNVSPYTEDEKEERRR
ncbi:MAG TPA: FapA family protein, partial [Spirochaetota bacterium]|nr:FapA family protein [Spirochaetota bacterium]